METYRISPQKKGSRFGEAFRFFLAIFLFRVLGPLIWNWISRRSAHGIPLSDVIEDAVSSGFYAALFGYRYHLFGDPMGLEGYDLLVREDEITAEYAISIATVHRGKIRTVREKRLWGFACYGLLVSERGRLGTLLRGGGVFIPEDLPEYQRLRDMVLTWKASAGPPVR